MALNTRGVLDPRWQFHSRIVEKSFALASIEIYNPATADSTYNVTTNTWSNSPTALWSGKARIQPRNASARMGGGGSVISAIDPGASQIVEVHIGLRENQLTGSNGAIPDLRPGHRMTVTDSPLDQTLCNFEFVVRSVLNGSNPWHRTLLCEVNQELNPNNA